MKIKGAGTIGNANFMKINIYLVFSNFFFKINIAGHGPTKPLANELAAAETQGLDFGHIVRRTNF